MKFWRLKYAYSVIDFTMLRIGCDKIRWDLLQIRLSTYRHTLEDTDQNLGHPRHSDRSTSPTFNPARAECFGVYDS
jgi:hypothetical protein